MRIIMMVGEFFFFQIIIIQILRVKSEDFTASDFFLLFCLV